MRRAEPGLILPSVQSLSRRRLILEGAIAARRGSPGARLTEPQTVRTLVAPHTNSYTIQTIQQTCRLRT